MRSIRFRGLWRGVNLEEADTPAALIREVLLIHPASEIPPLRVMNAVFRAGAGADGVAWEPFEIDPVEWAEIARWFAARGGVEPPDWVREADEWSAWRMERLTGIPAEEELRSARRDAWFHEQIRAALAAGDEERARELHWQRVEEGTELSRKFMDAIADRKARRTPPGEPSG